MSLDHRLKKNDSLEAMIDVVWYYDYEIRLPAIIYSQSASTRRSRLLERIPRDNVPHRQSWLVNSQSLGQKSRISRQLCLFFCYPTPLVGIVLRLLRCSSKVKYKSLSRIYSRPHFSLYKPFFASEWVIGIKTTFNKLVTSINWLLCLSLSRCFFWFWIWHLSKGGSVGKTRGKREMRKGLGEREEWVS